MSGEKSPGDREQRVDHIASELRSHATAVFAAFGAVCRSELGLEPETVLYAHLGPLYIATLELDQLEGAKPDRTIRREWRAKLAQKWREWIRD